LPINEAGLDVVVRIARDGLYQKTTGRSTRLANLGFSAHLAQHVSEADMIFLAVSTPTKTFGQGAGSAIDIADLKSAVEIIAAEAKPGAIIVEKSTVPCKTVDMIKGVVSVSPIQSFSEYKRLTVWLSYNISAQAFHLKFFQILSFLPKGPR
jgi:UDPglucose 6-dehydrogenase